MDEVAEIKSKLNIVDVIAEYINLKKAGSNFRGVCPFHNEKTPSFMVSPEIQIYKCFGCGESGDIFTFLQKNDGLTFPEALEVLSKRAGIKLKSRNSKKNSQKQVLKEINMQAARFYHYILLEHSQGKLALEYLNKERNLTLATIKKFQLGFSPQNSSLLFNYLTNKKKHHPDMIEKAGLVYKSRRGYVDRFRGRVIFPIGDIQNSVIAIAGRILPSLSGRGLAKYINSPETEIYHKSRSLYGLYAAKEYIKKEKSVVVVEGELDHLMSWQVGVRNVVAIKGTALTEEQVRMLSRFTDTIVLALDKDFAGDNAALRGIKLAQNANLELRVVDMGEHKDPDEFAQDNPEGYKAAINQSEDVWDYVIDTLTSRFDTQTGTGKSRAAAEILPLLANIDNSISKNHYMQVLAAKLDVGLESILSESRKFRAGETSRPITEKVLENKPKTRKDLLQEECLVLALRYKPEVLTDKDLKICFNKQNRRIISLLSLYLEHNNSFELSKFYDSLPKEISTKITELMTQNASQPENPEQDLASSIKELKLLVLRKNRADAIDRLKTKPLASTQKAIDKLSKNIVELEKTPISSII